MPDILKNYQPIGDYLKKQEFEQEIKKYQPVGDYASKSDLNVYASKSDLTKYQPAGNYAQVSELSKYQPAGDYAQASELKKYQQAGDYAQASELKKYQPAGDYAQASELSNYQPVGNYAQASELSKYQPAGNYAQASELSKYQPVGNYAQASELSKYAQASELSKYQPVGDYASRSELSKYQSVGDYASKTELQNYYSKSEFAPANYAAKTDLQNYVLKTEIPKSTPSIGALGPAGPKGDRGDQGALGPKGDKGDQGALGPAGPKGDKGDQGAMGAMGAMGPIGPKGDKGDQGLVGPSGSGMDKKNTLWCADGAYCEVPQKGISLADKALLIRGSGDEKHYLKFDVGIDGPVLNGYAGGLLSAKGIPQLTWHDKGVSMGALFINGQQVDPRRIDERIADLEKRIGMAPQAQAQAQAPQAQAQAQAQEKTRALGQAHVVQAQAEAQSLERAPLLRGRYITVRRIDNKKTHLNISAIWVYIQTGRNTVAPIQPVGASLGPAYLGGEFPATNLISPNQQGFAHTDASENAYMTIDLGDTYEINTIDILNRTDCCQDRMIGTQVEVIDGRDTYIVANIKDAQPRYTFENIKAKWVALEKMDFPGNDFASGVAGTPAEIMELCDKNPECLGFAYGTSGDVKGKAWLKNKLGEASKSEIATVYIHVQRKAAKDIDIAQAEGAAWSVYRHDNNTYIAARPYGKIFECISADGVNCFWRNSIGEVLQDIRNPPAVINPVRSGWAIKEVQLGDLQQPLRGRYITVRRMDNKKTPLNINAIIAYRKTGPNTITPIKPVGASLGPAYPGGEFPATNLINPQQGFAHTDSSENAYMTIDLGDTYEIDTVEIHNRKDCCQDRMIGTQVEVIDGPTAYIIANIKDARQLYRFENIQKKWASLEKMDFPGNDYASGVVGTPAEIMESCDKNQQCLGFAYGNSGDYKGKAWLKNKLENPSRSEIATMYVNILKTIELRAAQK